MIYEYQCDKCSQIIKLLVKAADDEIEKKCLNCNKGKYKRIISAPGGFNLKGEGFYCNDNRSK